MQFKFSFEIVKEDKIPLIDVTLTNKDNGRKVSYRALLDSGAFANVFHSDIAKVLGIDLTTIREQELFKGVEKTKRQMKGKPYIIEIMIIQKGSNILVCLRDFLKSFSGHIHSIIFASISTNSNFKPGVQRKNLRFQIYNHLSDTSC